MSSRRRANVKLPSDTMKRISARLPQSSIRMLEDIASERGITATAAIQSAIATEDFLRRETADKKSKILIQKPDGTLREIVLR